MSSRKKWKRLIELTLSVTMLVPAQAAYAAEGQTMESEMEPYKESRAADEFVIEDGVLNEYTGTATEVVIPEGVTKIGRGAFSDCSDLESVIIPEGVTHI